MPTVSATLWKLFLIASCALSFKIDTPGKSVIGEEIEDVTSVVLRESWLPGSTLVYVTDGTVPSASLQKITDNVGLDFAVGIVEILPSKDGDWSSVESSNFLDCIQQIQKTSRYTTTVLFSDSFIFLKEIIIKAADDDLLVWPARLLVITRSPQMRLHSLRKPLSAFNAMVIIQNKIRKTKRSDVFMYLPYSHRMIQVASWTPDTGISYIDKYRFFPDKFRRLTDGTKLQVTGLDFPPHVKVRNVASGEQGEFTYSGPVIVLLDMLAGDMNFTYSIVQPPDMSTGIRFPNGTWNGMVAMLQRKEVDFGLGLFGFTYLRAQIIDFTNPLVVDYGAILGRRGGTSVDPWGFALPFTFSVWAGFFATFIFILTLVSIISSLRWESGSPSPKISPAMYIRNLLQQDVNVTPKSNWEKLMVGVWLLFLLVFIECYSTNLVSLLAVRYISEPFQSLRDMLDDHTVTSIWIANSAYMQHLSAVESGIFREIADIRETRRMKLVHPLIYVSTVNDLVSKGTHIMINPTILMKMFLTEDYMDKGSCKFYFSKERFLPLTFCMAVPKHSPLRGPINEGIRAMVEGGIYNYLLDNAFTNAKSCKNPPTKMTVQEPLALATIWGMFAVLAAGYVLSFLVFFTEFITARYDLLAKIVPQE